MSTEFPAFQEHVLENELCPLVLVLAMDDSESYVRASAIKCLCAMVRVQRFWTDCLASQDMPVSHKTISLLLLFPFIRNNKYNLCHHNVTTKKTTVHILYSSFSYLMSFKLNCLIHSCGLSCHVLVPFLYYLIHFYLLYSLLQHSQLFL
jgi:hypothetical protein